MLSCLMIMLKNKHKTKDVSREPDKALHCTWEETTLRFSGVLSAAAFAPGYWLCYLLSRKDVLAWKENLGKREEEMLVKIFFFHGNTAGLVLGNAV